MTPVELLIREKITTSGSIPLDEFMNMVINYYYQHNKAIGKDGDFTTAPEVSQMFGEMIGIWCAGKFLGSSPHKFNLIEIGGGHGTLMKDLLRATKHIPNFHDSLDNIVMIENSLLMQEKQRESLKEYSHNLVFLDDLSHFEYDHSYANYVIANEFFDALPIKQFVKRKDGLKEILVTLTAEGAFTFTESDAKSIASVALKDGDILEVSEASQNYAIVIAELLKDNASSTALIIDYGYIDAPKHSTLQALKNHKYHDVFDDIGNADLTSHVDFKTLSTTFSNVGLRTTLKAQGEFLLEQGILVRADTLIQNGANATETKAALERLISRSEMGELFKVLELSHQHQDQP